MDDKIRGSIEKIWDDALAESIIPAVKWIQDAFTVKSLEDLSLGYIVGELERMARDIVIISQSGSITNEDGSTIKQMITRRLPEIMEKIHRELNT